MNLQTVCVIGGSGFVGRHIAHLLTRRAIRTRVPTRRLERVKQELIILPTVDVIEASVHEPQTLARLVAGCDAVINLVGILHEERPGDFTRVHTELPRRIVDACRAQGVKRLIHMSALKAAHNAPSEYLRSKAGGEQQVRVAEASGIRTTIFRPSVIFGRGDSFLTLFAQLARWAPVLPLACPNARFQPVWVEDVAAAIVGAITDSETFGQAYDLCGPKVYTLRQLVEYVLQVTRRRRWVIGLNETLSYLQAWGMEWMPVKLMTRDNLASMKVDNVCDCAFPAAFGLEPTPLEAVAPTYLAQHGPKARLNQLRLRARRQKEIR
ncbi:MAG TPA: complex I NDUFA9 subunit family protein [Burkholderiales bacterium]|nr:complex I NDUFA9 subunit family protein [Burkholderiales bacterium]